MKKALIHAIVLLLCICMFSCSTTGRTDTDKDEDFNSAKVAEFKRTVTVSTNFFVRFVANKPLMYGSISGMVAMVALGTGIGIKRRRRKVKNG